MKADNPGEWVLHCCNINHFGSGRLTILSCAKLPRRGDDGPAGDGTYGL